MAGDERTTLEREFGYLLGERLEKRAMKVAALAMGLFGVAFLVHWALWRIRLPRRQTSALLWIFLGTLPVGLMAMVLSTGFDKFAVPGFWQYALIAEFHVAMSLAYVVIYYGLEERSPSMTILSYVTAARGQGRTREELAAILRGFSPVEVRLDGLVRDKMVVVTDGDYRLTPKGRLWGQVFCTCRRLYRMERGG